MIQTLIRIKIEEDGYGNCFKTHLIVMIINL
jgi:hypothetical protein